MEIEKERKTEEVKPPEEEELKEFRCYVCGLTEKYSYFGSDPPFTRPLRFKEEIFAIRDPFVPIAREKNPLAFLSLGAVCSLCQGTVCCDSACSLFYLRRFCNPCAFLHKDKFPAEIQRELDKAYVRSKE